MNNIDWEEILTNTETAARSASIKSERTVSGVAELLQVTRRLSSEQMKLKEALTRSERCVTDLRDQLQQREPSISPASSHRVPWWVFPAIFAGGAMCAAFTLS